LLAILFGIVALAAPGTTAIAFVAVFAVWAFVDAAFAFAVAVQRGRAGWRWGWFAFEGIVGVAAGIAAISYPSITLVVLTVVVALRALLLGVLTIGAALTWKDAPWRWLYGLTGVVSTLFGILLLWHPLVGALALVLTIGIYALVSGVFLLVLSIRVHGISRGFPRAVATGR
jgi:uncharacterized membrane protein HdeD (DUF308 family)